MRFAAKSGLATAVLTLGLAACGTPGPGYDTYHTAGAYSAPYGVVQSVDVVAPGPMPGGTTGAGAVIGGIAGGVLGHQVGSGRGNDVATVAGAVGGAVVGNEVEKNRNAATGAGRYRITVRMDDGSYQTYVQDYTDVRPGDRVRIEGSHIARY
jgi:outer membrane lipoprotein SlyB